MSIPTAPLLQRRLLTLATAASLLLACRASAIDDNATKQIWKLKYGVSDTQISDNTWLSTDSDGDGIKNIDEIAAGTNPFSASKTIKVTSVVRNGANVDLTFPTESGKSYQAQSAASLTNPTWNLVGTTVTGDGAAKTLSPVFVAGNYYRVRVVDIDTDSDGISNWAETAVGLNPAVAETISGVSTSDYVNAQIALPNTVTITAPTPLASEDGPSAGKFTVTRAQNLFPLTVNLSTAGTAIPGTLAPADYSPLPASVTFPARGAISQDVFVNPIAPQSTPKGGRSVTATTSAPAGSAFPFASTSATVIINASTVASGTGLLAKYYDNASTTYADAANFGSAGIYTFTRSASPTTTGSIVVTAPASQFTGLQVGNSVKLTFNSGSTQIDNATYDHQSFPVTAVGASSFTVSINSATSFGGVTSTSGTCSFSIQSFPHPPALTRLDSTVNFDWQYGTPNGAVILPNNSPENYSDTFETYLVPTTTGTYIFQLDADDKARVFVDLNQNGTFELPSEQAVEHGWDSAATIGTFKQSGGLALVAGQHYKMRVEHVETTGDARCRLQWSINGGGFVNIPTANQLTHTQALNYSYASGNATIIPTGGHSLNGGDSVPLVFSSGVLSTPGTNLDTYSKSYTISSTAGTGIVTIAGASTSASSATVTVPSTAGLAIGMAITGTGLPANEFITAIGSGNITITTGTGVTAQGSTTLTATSTFVVPITPFTIPVASAATTAGSNFVTVPSTAGLATGMAITGTGLPANEFITSVINPTPQTPWGIITVTTATGITTQASTTLTAALPTGPTTGGGFLTNNAASTTTGVLNLSYPNTTFTGSPGRVGVDGAVTAGNNGLWNSGTPNTSLIAPDTFSVRWTGQVQPQFTEEYTFVVQADDGCALSISGQPQVLKMGPSANTGGATYTYDSTSGNVVVSYPSLITNANSFALGETVRLDPASGNLSHAPTTSPTYTYNGTTAIIDYSNLATRTAGSYVAGETVELDPTSGGLSSLNNLAYVVASSPAPTATTFAVAIPPPLAISSISPGNPCVVTTTTNHGLATGATVAIASVVGGSFSTPINGSFTVTVTAPNTFTVPSNCTVPPTASTGTVAPTLSGNITINDTRSAVITAVTSTTFTVNIGTGKYANASAGNMNIDLANKPLKDWSSNGNERFVRIPMIGGVRYDIQLEAYENTSAARCLLSWFSPSQPKQIIPAERLYPSSVPQAPPSHVTPTTAVALAGGPFSYAVGGTNGATVTISGNPAWLTYNGGVLSGTPPVGTSGDFQIVITTTNSAGTGVSVLNLHVDGSTGSVAREYWNGVPGTTVASIPTGTNPTGTGNLTSLLAPTDAGDNYGARIRGFITAPTSGNYYFWIAANNGAELWISNDDEPINSLKRAWVTTGSPVAQLWNAEVTRKSPWLALEEGKKYYFEILHKAGSSGDGSDNLAVGWSKPGEATTTPSEVVPGYVLSPYVAPAPNASGGTLYLATLLSQGGAVTNGVGTSTLRVTDDGSTAYMKYTYTGLTGPITSQHIHVDPYLTHPSAIVFDIDTPANPGDGLITNPNDPNYGSYKWTITAIAGLTQAEIVEIIREGKAYINLHTAAYPNGEIRGNYTLANGTRTFTPPPAPPSWSDDHTTNNGASRFLVQATFGANTDDIAALKAMASYDAWIDDQFTKPATLHLPEVQAREIADVFGPFDVKIAFNTWWKNSITGSDQLRQRVAFALSQIHVVSGQGPLEDNSRALAHFYDTLATNAFGNFRDVLIGTTLTPAMGRYLDMLRNDKPDLSVGRSPNENYAREIKQLFSIGLYRMWPDGTLMLTSEDSPIDTYTQREIVGLAHVFTGWDYGYDGDYRTSFSAAADWTRLMREVPARHFTGAKRVLNNEVLPGLATLGNQPLDAYATHLTTQINDPAYQALPGQELNAVHDMLFNHPNTGPFICRQLIQRLVTSNPSRDYLYRVVQKFNDNGSGVRGDMKAVIKAILLDYEARSTDLLAIPAYGKQREPLQRVANAARAFRPSNITGTYAQSGTNLITITTATPHLLQAGNSVFLEFTDTTVGGAPAPATGTYSVASVTSTTQYTVAAPGWMTGTYSQTAGSNVMTITMNGHWLPGVNASQTTLPAANWGQAYFDFTSGTANGLAGFDQTVRTVATSTSFDTESGVGNTSGTTFTITAPDTTARSGNLMITRLPGSYSCTGRAGIITIDTNFGGAGTFGTMADHGLIVGNTVFLNFMNSRDTTSGDPTSTENDLVYTVTSVPDLNTFTVAARDAANAAMNSDNQVTVFPLKAQPLTRNGTIVTRQGTFTMDNTDTDLQQTPLNSPTVFNYFLPDYRYAGTLASQGITTPEFQLTSETTVVRQANFIYNGLFNPSNTTGISSFKTGSNALVLDFSPWSGNAVSTAGTVGAVLGAGPQTGQVWTSNANVSTLVDRFNTLLLGGTLPANAKTQILNFLGRQITGITTGSPCTINMGSTHGLAVGDSVTITGITGGTFNTGGGNGTFTVASVPTTSTLTLTGLNCTSTTTNGGLNLTNSTLGIVAYTNATPTAQNIRDRIRAIIHFILTSPDYTIQR